MPASAGAEMKQILKSKLSIVQQISFKIFQIGKVFLGTSGIKIHSNLFYDLHSFFIRILFIRIFRLRIIQF